MKDRAFVDTNIFVYLVDRSNKQKRDKSRRLIKTLASGETLIISYQVIQEFCNLAKSKFETQFRSADLMEFLQTFMYPYCEVFASLDLIDEALGISDRYGFGFYDSLIIGASIRARCEILYSEDLQHGQVVKGVEIINPFR